MIRNIAVQRIIPIRPIEHWSGGAPLYPRVGDKGYINRARSDFSPLYGE